MKLLEKDILIGVLNVNDKLLLTDPCYELGTWCTGEAVLPYGSYNCYCSYKDKRVANIYLVNADIKDLNEVYKHELISDNLGVDSGQLGIFNTIRYNKQVSKEEFEKSLEGEFPYEDWKRPYNEDDTDHDSFYRCCGNYTLSKQNCGVIKGVGFVSSSGYGDGVYEAYYLVDNKGEKVGLQVEFI